MKKIFLKKMVSIDITFETEKKSFPKKNFFVKNYFLIFREKKSWQIFFFTATNFTDELFSIEIANANKPCCKFISVIFVFYDSFSSNKLLLCLFLLW